MKMHPITSDSLHAVGYDAERRTLRVEFENGGVYDYFDIDPSLYDAMLRPHPWRTLSETVKAHAYRRVH